MGTPSPNPVRTPCLLAALLPVLLAAACSGGGSPAPDGGPDAFADTVDVPVPADPGPDSAGDAAGDPAGDGAPDAPDLPDPGPLDVLPDVAPPPPVEHGGVTARAEGARVVLDGGLLRVVADPATGRFQVDRARDGVAGTGWTRVVDGAESRSLYRECVDDTETGDPACVETWAASGDPGAGTWEAAPFEDPLGTGVELRLARTPSAGGPVLVSRFQVRGGTAFLTADVVATWTDDKPGTTRRLLGLSPLAADGDSGGALYLGPDPATHRVLDDGYDVYFDYESLVRPVGSGTSLLFPPGVAANWAAGIQDPVTGAALAAGFLAHRKGVGVVIVDHDPSSATTLAEEGQATRSGMTRFEGHCHYIGGRAATALDPVADGAGVPAGARGLRSEPFYLEPFPASAQQGLEDFARRYARRIGKRVWTDIPSSWNSWGGGAGSGGYGTNIDEALILQNLDLAAADFLPHRMEWFMVDDGWEAAVGDWWPNPDRFPDHQEDGVVLDGMAWMAKQIRARGMIPGLWISPITLHEDSLTLLQHPDWVAEVGGLGAGFVPADERLLDLTNPEVLEWLAQRFRQITQEWGYRWIKMDFSYFAMFATNLHDPDVSATEAYVNALDVIREAIGPDTFLLLVSAMGLTFDVADGNRITLDNEPWWGDPVGSGDQGYKVTVTTVAHRYWQSHNLWINHPDLVFFRDDYGLTMAEARTYASLVALTGGIVKMGENFVDLHDHPEWREVVYRLLPVYPRSARPLDLFTREYPERWLLPVDREDRRWHVLGLFHWGVNRDVGGPWVPADGQPEAPAQVDADLAALGVAPAGTDVLALDAWDGTWEWVTDGHVRRTLQPRSERVLVLHPRPDRPALAGTDLHLLGGAVEVASETWDAAAGRLRLDLNTVPGRDVTVFVMDAGRPLAGATVATPADGSAAPMAEPVTEARDGVVTVTFGATAASTRLELAFGEATPRTVPACPAGAAPAGSLADKAAFLDARVRGNLMDDGLIRTVREDADGNVLARDNLPSTGLWTAMYLASQSYRWSATRDPEALDNARRAVEGLHHLTAVTGIPGLYGRAYQRPGFTYAHDAAGRKHWVASTAPGYEGWYWNDDVSKDTMDGILFGYAAALDLLEDPGIRAAVRADVLAFAKHLVGNGLQIIDHTGEVTEHGRLMYGVIDEFPGFNALLTLSWLTIATDAFEELSPAGQAAWDGPDLRHFLDDCLLRLGDRSDCPELDGVDLGSYLDVAEDLLGLYMGGCKTSYDQIDMVFHAIHPLMRREHRPAVRDRLRALLDRGIWEPADEGLDPPVHRSTHSLYIFLYGALAWPGVPATFQAAWEDAVCTLDALPRDRRDVGAVALDVPVACTNRMGRGNAAEVIPVADRDYDNYLWRLDPYEITRAREAVPGQVHSPEDFLLAYWLGRHAGFLTAAQ